VLCNRQIVTVAGTASAGYNGDDQAATQAQLSSPTCVFVSSRHEVYISDKKGHLIRKIYCDGTIKTIAGTGIRGYNGDNQLAIQAQLDRPSGLFVTDCGEVLFVDSGNNRIRMIQSNGMIVTIAGNGTKGYNGDGMLATDAQLYLPMNVFKYKNEVYISDWGNNRIRKILQNGIIVTIAGNGKYGYNGDNRLSIRTQLSQPFGLHVHNDEVYFSEKNGCRIRKILSNGTIATIAGNGVAGYNGDNILATQSQLNEPSGIFVSNCGHVYIADYGNHRIRMVDSQSGMISTIAGTGQEGFSGDVPFDFEKYPHIGRKYLPLFSKRSSDGQFTVAWSYCDMVIKCSVIGESNWKNEPPKKKTKQN